MPDTDKVSPFRILVFGQSNATGVVLADRNQAWPYVVGRALESRLGRPVEVTVRPIYVHLPGAMAYLERELAKHHPDLVLLGATPYAFAQKQVGESLQGRFGAKTGNWYRKLEETFDRKTRHSPLGARINRGARWLAAKVLGAKPVSTYDAVITGHAAVTRRLVQEESVALTVYSLNAFNFSREDPQTAALLARFDDDIAAITGQARAGRFDGKGRIGPASADLLLPDHLHFNAKGHAFIAAEVLRAIDAGEIAIDR